MIALALWLALSPLFAWMAGRFIRVGMVELQPVMDHQARELEVDAHAPLASAAPRCAWPYCLCTWEAMLVHAAGLAEPIPGRVAVTLKLYPHRPLDWKTRQRKLGAAWDDGVRSIDLDNSIKVTLDAMKGVAFHDDVWVRQIAAERMEPDGEARVVVTITAMPVAQPQVDLLGEAA